MSVSAQWSGKPSDIVQLVLDEIRSALPEDRIESLDLETSLAGLGLDSLATLEAVNRIEAVFGIRFTEDSLYDIESCQDLVRTVTERLGLDASSTSGGASAPNSCTAQNSATGQLPTDQLPCGEGDPTQFLECQAFEQRLAATAAVGLTNPFYRVKQAVNSSVATVAGREVISFTSFDYLGLGTHPRVVAAAQAAIARYGTSASASRLVGGNSELLSTLDVELAELVGTEAAIALPSGYGTNASILGHLFGEDDLILYDELAHNSIMQGAQLSGARRRAFRHNDYAFVDAYLADTRSQYRRVAIAIEGVYSMDGDFPNLPGFLEVKRRHAALLYVDEAHSVGVMGATGRGICEHFGVDPAEGDLWMGTISKALASGGGYLAGRAALINYLKYSTPALVFATAPSPANSAAALEAIRCLRDEPGRIQRLRENALLFLKLAQDVGMDTGASGDTPIIPILVGGSARALELSQRLLDKGIDAQPILYPAVPESGARIRFFITANHTEEQIVAAVQAMADSLAEVSG